jgi:hypothetical protein
MKKQSKPKKLTENQFPNLTPRRGSLPGDYNRPSPRTPKLAPYSPTTPNSPDRLNPLTFSPQLESFDEDKVNEVLDELLIRGNNSSSNQLLNKLLEQKEKEIIRLEQEKSQLLQEKQIWENSQIKIKQLEKTLLQKNKKFEELKTELKETETDFYQVEEKNDELNHSLAQERLNNRKLEKRLEQQINEND